MNGAGGGYGGPVSQRADGSDVEVVPGVDVLVSEWDDLAERLDCSPFMRPGWISAWLEAFGAGAPRLVTVRRSGGLAGVLPMHLKRGRLCSTANWHSPGFHLVAADDSAREALLAGLFCQPHATIELQQLDSGTGKLGPIAEAARESGRLVVIGPAVRAPFIDVADGFDDYERRLSRNLRANLRRRRRKLEAVGNVSFDVNDAREALDERLAEAFAVEASGWKARSGTAMASRPDTQRFYTDVARWAAARGWLRLSFLRVDGRPIACDYAIVHRGVWHSLKAGYDEVFSSFGPGALLLRELLVHCFDQDLSRVELMAPNAAFKQSWTFRFGQRTWLQAFRRGSSAGLADWARVAGRERVRSLAHRVRPLAPSRGYPSPQSRA